MSPADPKNRQSVSISKFLASRAFIWFTISAVLFSFLSGSYLFFTLQGSQKERLSELQSQIIENLRPFIVTGIDYATHAQCEKSLNNSLVTKLVVISGDRTLCDVSTRTKALYTSQVSSPVYFDKNQTQQAATIVVSYNQSGSLLAGTQLFAFLVLQMLFFAILAAWLSAHFNSVIARPIQTIAERLKDGKFAFTTAEKGALQNTGISEISEILGGLLESLAKAETLQKQMAQKQTDTRIIELSRQVAHDIRSPLAALAMIEQYLSALPEEVRVILRSAFSRIRDIANTLLDSTRESSTPLLLQKNETQNEKQEELKVQLLPALIDSIVTEKRMQFRSQLQVNISFETSHVDYGKFVLVSLNFFKRVISNIINNAVEALPSKGTVTIRLKNEGDFIVVEIADNGKGIPAEVLAKLGTQEFTHGKVEGNGIGLFHARNQMHEWGGSFEIVSQLGFGTQVLLKLPKQLPPRWFLNTLKIEPRSVLVILDDDESIHQIWHGRYETSFLSKYEIELKHVSNPDDFRALVTTLRTENRRNAKFLVDYELLGFKDNGIDLAEEMDIAACTTLVTSRYEEEHVRIRCATLGIPLIPKGMAAFIPIQVLSPTT